MSDLSKNLEQRAYECLEKEVVILGAYQKPGKTIYFLIDRSFDLGDPQ